MYITPVKRAIYFEIHAWWLNGAATEGLSPYPVRIDGRAGSFAEDWFHQIPGTNSLQNCWLAE